MPPHSDVHTLVAGRVDRGSFLLGLDAHALVLDCHIVAEVKLPPVVVVLPRVELLPL